MNTEKIHPTNQTDAVTDAATSAAVAADLVARHIKPELVEVVAPDGSVRAPLLVLPSGLKAHAVKDYLAAYRTAPERREGTARLVELASFIDHVNRFKDDDSALFAWPDDTGPTLTAVLDYHRRNLNALTTRRLSAEGEAGSVLDVERTDGAPRFGRHRALYPFPLSEEWRAWAEKDGEPMGQAEFATWLEDRIVDVTDPGAAFAEQREFAEALGIDQFASPSRLLTLSRGLTVHVDERVTNKIDPTTGETTMHYEASHQDVAGGALSVPRAFLIRIPVFRSGLMYQFAVRLKYRVAGGRVTWFYEVHRAAAALDDAFRGACLEAAEKTALPLFFGAPEA